MSNYEEPSTRLVRLFREVFKDGPFKAVYDGDPDLIPASNYPALCVVQVDDTNDPSDNMSDEVSCNLQIRLVFDKRADWGTADPNLALTDQKIRNIVEQRDPDTGTYLATTIKGAIRSRLQLDPESWLRRNMRFELGSQLRLTGNNSETVTREGVVTVTIMYPIDIANMS